jgi:hypothetical protein
MEYLMTIKILASILTALLFLGCSSKATEDENIVPRVVVNYSLESLKLNDQNGKPHTISADTKTVVFAFSKDVGHTCNNFFATKADSYLSDNNTMFIADVSGAPSLIRSMFIMPGLKDFKHTVLVIDDKALAASYKAGLNTENIIVVSVNNKIITAINGVSTTDELAKNIEAK